MPRVQKLLFFLSFEMSEVQKPLFSLGPGVSEVLKTIIFHNFWGVPNPVFDPSGDGGSEIRI